jgi:hypothetical protein
MVGMRVIRAHGKLPQCYLGFEAAKNVCNWTHSDTGKLGAAAPLKGCLSSNTEVTHSLMQTKHPEQNPRHTIT